MNASHIAGSGLLAHILHLVISETFLLCKNNMKAGGDLVGVRGDERKVSSAVLKIISSTTGELGTEILVVLEVGRFSKEGKG